MRYFKVKNFEKYQPRRNGKNAPWIRLYHTWNMDSAIGQLHDSHKAHWIGIICIAHTEDNQVPYNPVWIKRRGGFSSPVKLELFEKLGLIEVFDNKDDFRPVQKSQEKKKEKEKEKKKKISSKREVKDEKPTDPNIKVAIDYYFNLFTSSFGSKPKISGVKDATMFKRTLDCYGIDKTLALIDRFMASEDPFIEENGRSLHIFESQINKLLINTKPVGKVDRALQAVANWSQDETKQEDFWDGGPDVIDVGADSTH